MTPYLFAAAVGVLCGAGGYLKGIRQHVAEHQLAAWVHDDLVAAPATNLDVAADQQQQAEFEVDDATMRRLLELLNSPLTVALEDTDYWAPIAAGMGPVPVEPELVSA